MNGIAAYKRTRVESAPNELVILMLLEKVLDDLKVARAALDAGNRSLWNSSLHRCRAIFIELFSALDTSENPEVTIPLSQTWVWCNLQLSQIARAPDLATVKRVEDVVGLMHQTWTEALEIRDEELAAS